MIRKTILLIVFSLFPIFVLADELVPAAGWYLRFDTGLSSARGDNLGTSSVFGGGLGYAYVAGLRGDLTLTYRPGFDEDFQALTTLLSLYLDLYSTPRVSPYAGFGLGFSRNKLDNITSTEFAWQICAGANVQLGNRWLLDIGYHLLKSEDLHSHELLASLQYTF